MKILIIKPSSFGDIIQANPIISAIKSTWNSAQIDWLVFSKFKEVVELFPNITNIHLWDRKGGVKAFFEVLKKCNEQNYDLVIDLQGLLRTSLLAKLIKAKQKVGVSGMKELSWLLLKEPYKRNKEENAVIRNLNSLSYITKQKYNPEFKINIDTSFSDDILNKAQITSNDSLVAFVPFARGKNKTLKSEIYCSLAKAITDINKNIKIVVLGGKESYNNINSANIIDLCGKTSIKQLASILKRCKFAIGADTGAMHLSNAIGTKSLFVFGGSDIKETSPYGTNSQVLSLNLSCSPCRGKCKYATEKCLDGITPKMVMDKIEQWIK